MKIVYLVIFSLMLFVQQLSAGEEAPVKQDAEKKSCQKQIAEKEQKEEKEDKQEKKGEKEENKDKVEKQEKKDKEEKKEEKDKEENNKKAEEEKTLKVGNYALPTSQQPGPLVSFGERIVGKDVLQFLLFGDHFQRQNGHFTDLLPGFVWGMTDAFSIFWSMPYAVTYKDRASHSSGIEDVFVQFEYAFYSLEKRYYTNQATLVCSVLFPTGSNRATPPTGFGSPSYFLGATYNHTELDWLYFGSIGSLLTSCTKHCTKFGPQLFYEFGFGRNIPSPKGWIYAWMVEIDGLYSCRNRIHGVTDPNSGGNLIIITPSIWVSNEKFIFQLGVGGPLYQHLFGNQIKYLYHIIFEAGYTF
jgi:hypothetical protein